MPDISRHLERARQGIQRRNYDLAIEICLECQEVEPSSLENYQLLLEAAKRRLKETGKKGGLSLGFSSKDPHKALTAAVKKVSRNPDGKACASAGDAARAVFESGQRKMAPVAILFYEEVRSQGLYNKDVLWNLGHMYFERSKEQHDLEDIDQAIQVMHEMEQGQASHSDAARTVKAWEATRSMWGRGQGGSSYKSQLASDREARRNEVMGRVIRTPEDAKEVLEFVAEDLREHPDDKRLWQKKGDVHRRVGQYDEALSAFAKAQEIDEHDFVVTIRIGDTRIDQQTARIKALKQAGQEAEARQAEAELLQLQVDEYSKRHERQPTEMAHRYELGRLLLKRGEVDQAAAHFQQAKHDARFRRKCLNYLGHCFAKKNLLDIARDQFTECLSLIEDNSSNDYKEVLYNRARVAEASGDTSAASGDFRKLVEIDLGYRDAAERLSKLK